MQIDKQNILKKLKIEKDYYEVEFIDKQRLNKIEFRDKIFDDFISNLVNSTIERTENRIVFIDKDLILTVEQTSNIEKEPKKPLIFKIDVRFDDSILEFLLRPFNNSTLPTPDFSRLLINPYKGKDLLDIEVEEEQKNIDFFKRYINENIDISQYVYAIQDKEGNIVECKSINEVLKIIRE